VALEVTCRCGRRLCVADRLAGRSVRCPECRASVAVPAEADCPFEVVEEPEPAKPPDEPSPADREVARKRRKARRRRSALDRVQTGLTLALVKILLQILGVLVLFALAQLVRLKASALAAEIAEHARDLDEDTVADDISSSQYATLLRIVVPVRILVQVVPAVLGLVATGLCLGAPKAAGVRGLLVGTLVADAAHLAGTGLQWLGAFRGLPTPAVVLMMNLVAFTAWLLFMLFLRRMADYVRDSGTVNEADAVLLRGGVVWAGAIFGPLLGGLVIALGCFGGLIVLALIVAWIIYALLFLLRYMAFLSGMRDAVARA
jgi:hypothetical protein